MLEINITSELMKRTHNIKRIWKDKSINCEKLTSAPYKWKATYWKILLWSWLVWCAQISVLYSIFLQDILLSSRKSRNSKLQNWTDLIQAHQIFLLFIQ